MAETTHTDRTVLEMAGRVDQSLNGASKAAVSALGRIQSASAKASQAMTRGFSVAGAQAVSLNRTVGLSAGAMLAWGGAVAAAMLAWREGSKFVHEALEAASDEKLAITARKLTVSLENIPFLARQGKKAIEGQAEAISETAARMEKFSGTSEAIFKSSFATLVSFGATKTEVNAIAKPMADWLALTKGTAASMEDSVDLANKIGAAVDSKKIGRWAKDLGLSPEQQKQWKGLTSNFERLNFLGAAMEKRSKGQAASQVGSLGGQLLLAHNEEQRILAQYGGVFKKIQLTWQLAVVGMEKALLPLAGPAIDGVRKAFETVQRIIGEIGARLQTPEMTGIWKNWQTEILKVQGELKPMTDFFEKNFSESSIVSFFAKDLPNDCANALAAFKQIEEVCKRIGDIWNGIAKVIGDVIEHDRKVASILFPSLQNKSDVEATRKDAEARVARGGQVQDVPGAFPNTLKAQKDSTEKVTAANKVLENANKAVQSSMMFLNEAANNAALTLDRMGKGGNYGIHGDMSEGSSQPLTEYGPGVPGDQPGGPTYDKDSYNRIGHILGKKYALSGGDSAMKYDYGTKHYHIQPGESYISDKDHQRHVWHDTTGAKNPEKEDIFKDKPGANSRPARGGHTINLTVNAPGATHSVASAIKGHLQDSAQELLRQLKASDEEDYRTSFA
jgi:hypothetical protein